MTDMEYISVTNWNKYQHYTDRKMVWLKLYPQLLDNYEYQQLSDHDKLLFVEILMLSAKFSNQLPNDQTWLKKQLTVKGKITFTSLISLGFLECYQDASKTLASCYQNDTHSYLFLSYWKDNNLEKEFRSFARMRKQIKKPINDVAESRLVAKHKRLVAEGHDPAEIINQSTACCWQGFHEVKDRNENRRSNRAGVGRNPAQTPSDIQRQAATEYIRGLADGNGNSVADDDGLLRQPLA